MKKLFIGMFSLLLALSSYAQKKPLCLNGFTDVQAATAVMQDFRNYNDNYQPNPNPAILTGTRVWFPIDMVKKMVALLTNEVGPKGEKVDGIRIYYARYNNQNTVILVSTYDAGPSQKNPGYEIHQDYFLHDSNNTLFTDMDAVKGAPTTNSTNGAGEELYVPCPTCLASCPTSATNLHYISRGSGENMVAAFGKAKINTYSEWFPLCLFVEMTNNHPYDGMRVYFAKHLRGDPAPFADRDAFIIENTVQVAGTSIHDDSFDCNFAKCDNTNLTIDLLVKKIVPAGNGKILSKPLLAQRKALTDFIVSNGFDNGEECPNACEGVTWP